MTPPASAAHGTATRPGPVPTGLARGLRRPWLLALPAAVLAFTALALWLSGSAAGTVLKDPGAVVRWALPLVQSVQNLTMAATMGSLLFAVAMLPRWQDDARGGRRRTRKGGADGAAREEYGPFSSVLNLAAVSALTWTIAAIAVLVLQYGDVSGGGVAADSAFTSQLLSYVQNIAAGQQQATIVVVAAVVATLAFGVRSLLGLGLTLALTAIPVVAMALSGHSSGGDDHMGAVNSLGLHLLGVCLWFGGLVALAWISREITAKDAGTGTVPERVRGAATSAARRVPMAVAVIRRYSAVALLGFLLVSASGVLNSAVRLHGWADLGTTYGLLIVAKALLTLLLGLAGAAHRLWLIPRVESGALSAFKGIWQIIAAELVLMAAASGLAVALSRTAPPVSEQLDPQASPARIITWYDMPPEPTPLRWLTTWRFDWFWVFLVLFLAWAYVWAFVRVRRNGGRWHPLRLASWLVGLAALTYCTSGPFAVYSRVLFSVHMMEHMTLTMIVPMFLVSGAPVTLWLQALEPRQDGTMGPREWILRIVHSTWSKIITNPIVAAVNFAGSIIVFYFTGLFGITLRYHVGHEFMMVHFLLTGYLFALVLIGKDPIPHRPDYPIRLVMLIATLGYHAFVGIAIMHTHVLLQASWFGNLGRTWGPSALQDQNTGGAFMWALGEIPTMVLAVIMAVQWSRAGEREAQRVDRQADRDHDAELTAYNRMFERLNERDRG